MSQLSCTLHTLRLSAWGSTALSAWGSSAFLLPWGSSSGSGTSGGSTAETSEKCSSVIVTCLSRQAEALSINTQCQHGKVTAYSKLLSFLAQHTLRRDLCLVAFRLSSNMTLDVGQVFCYVICTAFTMSDLQRKVGTIWTV